MSKYVSNGGEWHPAKEKVALENLTGKTITYNGKKIQPGEPFIYEGADRSALEYLHKKGLTSLGTSFRMEPEFLQAVRNQGFNTVEEYLKAIRYDEKKAKEDFDKRAEVINNPNELAKKAKMVETMGGGTDTSGGGQHIDGGFGELKM